MAWGGQAEAMGSSRGCGFEPWLGGLAWLSCGSHLARRKAGRSSRLNWSRIRSSSVRLGEPLALCGIVGSSSSTEDH
ncbi:hypothetical protein CRG98_020284 [Punica granatum]|uniref:Uncharacterized protein n=1 Tax=Punica granatum TaxID=22663 RepID=A0A2I0JSN5_PUNGR|nr:hypothetical protein CRG98_020284 [Punica granatum]